ncbi:MAG: phosphoserine phosphatase SerB [Geminicoccaceae bacterium]
MPAVACLIADRELQPLDPCLVDEACGLLAGPHRWLSETEAVEIMVPELEPVEAAGRLADLLRDQPVDHAVLPPVHRRKKLLLCDMDSTVIQIECIDELADFAGIKPQIAAVTRRAMNGELDFEEALRARVALLKGLPEAVIAQVIAERLVLTPGARTLVATMRANGARTALVSGGFTPFTRQVQGLCGFDEEEANGLEVVDGRLSGRIAGPVRGAAAKLAALRRLRTEVGLLPAEVLAVGDGANDLPMLEEAGLGVGYRPQAHLRGRVDACIDYGDLTAALFLQGYRRDEFVAA